ncbi:interferon-gamma-inducible GTPase 10-like [Gastrophryne carolinensis]
MEARYRFDTFSSEEIREIAQALRENGGAGGAQAISEFELQEIINALQEANRTEPMDRTNSIERDTGNPTVNIAVTGESGSGKSTFINIIRGLVNDEVEGAAKTGVVETTKHPASYPHPRYSNVRFWDLPGSGTPGYTFDDFQQPSNCHQYVFFIIVTFGRVRHNDLELAKELWLMGKKFFFVRSKIDCDLRASKLRRNKTYNEEKILKNIRDNCIKNLTDCGIEAPLVFLISCLEPEKYDFSLLKKTIEEKCTGQQQT